MSKIGGIINKFEISRQFFVLPEYLCRSVHLLRIGKALLKRIRLIYDANLWFKIRGTYGGLVSCC